MTVPVFPPVQQQPIQPVVGAIVDPVPAVVLDVDVARPVPAIDGYRDGRRVAAAWILVRAFTEPLGQSIVEVPAEGVPAAELAARIEREYGAAVRERVAAAGGDPAQGVPPDGVRITTTPPYVAQRAAVLADAPEITVVVCTREHPEPLRLTLESLVTQEYPAYRILVVDNAPRTDATARVVRSFAGRGVDIEYLLEPRPGLSRARNAAVAAAPGEILAFTDDDVVVDRYWLAEVARGFAEVPDADVVTGLILPAELETPAQVWFEEYGGHSKGRGFTPAVFRRRPGSPYLEPTPGVPRQHHLYPLPPFGAGANMVFLPGVAEAIGGFDEALGAGTPAMGSEDTLALMRVLHDGGTIAYRPTALVRHYHRRDLPGLAKQLTGYGTGLTAAYLGLLRQDPRTVGSLLSLVPSALRDLRAGSAREAGLSERFPRQLLGLNRSGMLRGPLAYLRGRRALRRGHPDARTPDTPHPDVRRPDA
jgi:GT2 family glycosyltransferase